MTHEELKKCIGEYKELKKDLWLTSCWGAKKIEGYDFGVYYNEFAGHWQFCWKDPENEFRVIDIKYIFDSQEDAEWEEEFGDITRTERLELPTWDEFIKDENFIEGNEVGFYDDVGIRYKLLKTQYTIPKMICLFEEGIQGDYICEKYELTKENYMIVCRKAKELFLGEKE